ncbi:MAG: hypothetical protein AAGJ52_14245 [Pseudomonadota bacterium]
MNDIRLLATFEVETTRNAPRSLDRESCAALAEGLAQDLVRQSELAGQGLLVVGGGLFEPAEILRPGLPAWQALGDFSKNAPFDPEAGGQIMAIGAHQGRLPDARLAPTTSGLDGQLLALPVLLRCTESVFSVLSEQLESNLFESGGLHPPTRAAFSQGTGLDTGHGQLMTLTDLIALTHVQMDTAGLGAFWPVIEHGLIEPGSDQRFDLPGPLDVHWSGERQDVHIEFQTFNDFDDDLSTYAVWTRAFRSLSALLTAHGIRTEVQTRHTLDLDRRALVESAGPSALPSGLTEQVHEDCGLLCWTLIEDGRCFHLYPLDANGVELLLGDFKARGLEAVRPGSGVQLAADKQTLEGAH